MHMKQILLASAATVVLSMPVMAAEMGTGSMTGTSGVTGTTKTTPTGASSNSPATGPNSTAIPEVPATGATTTTGATIGEGTTGTPGKDGGASSTDLQHQLTTKGYTSITPTGSAGAATSGETRFNATNSAGQKVLLTVNANTGEIVKEIPAE